MTRLPELQTRQDAFTQQVGQICGSFDVEFHTGPFHAQTRCIQKSGLELALIKQNAAAVKRCAHNIRRDPGNHFFLVMQNHGEAYMEQLGIGAQLQSGDMYLVDSAKPSAFHYEGKLSDQISLHLPREQSTNRFGARIKGGIFISRKDPLAQAMRNIVEQLLRDDDPRQAHISEAFYSVLGAYLFNRSMGEHGQLDDDQQITNRAHTLMSQHYIDPDFTPSHLADLTGVSLRRLQRAFARAQTTPHKALQDIRLDACCALLQDLERKDQSIADIAFKSGFRDLSTFYRHFSARFACSPKVWRSSQ